MAISQCKAKPVKTRLYNSNSHSNRQKELTLYIFLKGEISHLKITDIDSKAMRIKIVQGKGLKDRYTILSQQVLVELRAYYLMYKPQDYLFNGYKPGKPLSVRMIQHMVQNMLIQINRL